MSRRDVKVGLNKLLLLELGTGALPSGLNAEVKFSRTEKVQIPSGKDGVYSVGWGKEAQMAGALGGCPTARLMPCIVDIYGRDEETADLLYEELKDTLEDAHLPNFLTFSIDASQLYSETIEADGVRATVLCAYVA